MKRTARIASLLLVLSLLLCSLCACRDGAAQPTPTTAPSKPKPVPTLADCTAVDGMLAHTSAKAYSYNEIAGIVSTRNLLFVPSGTVVSSEWPMAVYTYDETLTLKSSLLEEIGQTTVGDYIVMMAAGSVTMTEDCYIRVAVRESLENVKLTYPEARKGEAYVYDVEYETYQRDYDRILPLVTASKDTVNYLFITDVHHDQNTISAVQRASLK